MRERLEEPGATTERPARAELMERHAAARRQREMAPLGSDEFRAAAEEIARIEIAIAMLEEPPPTSPAGPGRG